MKFYLAFSKQLSKFKFEHSTSHYPIDSLKNAQIALREKAKRLCELYEEPVPDDIYNDKFYIFRIGCHTVSIFPEGNREECYNGFQKLVWD